tara:strand:- start:1312 stop:1719 length:408 start_codon:yes stop_codon:yes gene_type:complete
MWLNELSCFAIVGIKLYCVERRAIKLPTDVVGFPLFTEVADEPRYNSHLNGASNYPEVCAVDFDVGAGEILSSGFHRQSSSSEAAPRRFDVNIIPDRSSMSTSWGREFENKFPTPVKEIGNHLALVCLIGSRRSQ